MRVYWEVARRSFRRQSTYRLATIAGLFTNVVFGFARAYILRSAAQSGDLAGYDATDLVTYSFVSQGLLMVVSAFALGMDLSPRIRTGDVAIDLYRPVSFQGYWAATDVGRAAFQAVARGIPPLLIAAAFFAVRGPAWAHLPGFIAAVCLALAVSFGLRYVLALSTFWLLDDRGVNILYFTGASFLGGLYVPIALMPDGLREVTRALPFATLFQVPVDAWLGRPVGGALALGAAWAVGLGVLGALVTRVATSKVVVQGG